MLTTIDRICADNLYEKALTQLLAEGTVVAPRGQKTVELSPVALELKSPFHNVICSPFRKVSFAFLGAELLWMLMGRDDVEMVKFYNGAIANYSDDGQILRGAYGPRLMPQLFHCYELLKKDPDSRQAVITLWQPEIGPTKDVPCTVMFHFILRNGFLNLQVYMRSNDAWLGFPYDLHNFTCIQILLAEMLGANPGHYYHFAGSWHLYEIHFAQAKALSMETPLEDCLITDRPIAHDWKTLMHLLQEAWEIDEQMRAGKLDQAERRVTDFADPLIKQKLGWMLDKARRKHGL